MRSGANNDNSLGQSAFSIAFTANGTVYTKYTIVKDTQRSNALGIIAFSLFLNYNKILKGEEIISLLGELSKKYSNNYIKNNYLNRGEKTLIREDWDFVNALLTEYKEQVKIQKNEELESGNKDAAFIYYKNEDELKEYFNKPFQEEYSDYKQVLFISIDLKDNLKNPLNVLSNSGEELKDIDLKNEYYYLDNYSRSKGVSIIADGKERTDVKNNNCIRAKWQVEIKYSKEERCFWPIQAKGTLSNPDSEIYKYLELKNNQISIKYDAFNTPEPKVKTISIEIKDRKGNYIDEADIQIGTKPYEKIGGHQYECTFSGEDLIKRWDISVKKGVFSGNIDLLPENQIGNIVLVIQEHINATFLVKDDKGLVFDYNIQIKNQQGDLFSNSKEPEFIGEDIDKLYDITILSNKHESKSFPYCPAKDENPKDIKLINKQLIEYPNDKGFELIINNKFGKRSFKNKPIGKYEKNKPEFGCDPNFGYKFIEWKYQEQSSKDYDGYYEAIFKKMWYNKIPKWCWIVSSIAAVFIIVFTLIYKLSYSDNPQSHYEFPVHMQKYVQGDSLFLDTLNIYKQDLEHQNPGVIEKKRGLFDWFMGRKKENDSTEYNDWKENIKSIEDAINKRNLINDKEFKKLLKLDYSLEQQNLEIAIQKIDSTKYNEIRKNLGDVSNKTLSEIADAINDILKPKESLKDEELNVKEEEKKSSQKKETPSTNTLEQPQRQAPQKQKNIALSSNTNEIIQYIKGGELKKNKLEEYKQHTSDPVLKSTIDLILKIWKLDGNGKNTYSSIQQSCNENKYLKDSELHKTLKSTKENANYAGLTTAEDILKKLKSKGQ
ncbi:hypothetical protein FEM08_20490 [Flavobacterium gilvum]|nr:hypothetical protein FEM08_20490 [Flavobacterium gilvum]